MRARPRSAARRSARLLRWLAVAVVCAIVVAYVQPIRSYLDARDRVAERRSEQQALLRKEAGLRDELELAGTDTFIEREARLIGLVRPGEKLFIVRGIEAWKASQGRTADGRSDE